MTTTTILTRMCMFEGEFMPEFITNHHIVHVRTNTVLNAHMFLSLRHLQFWGCPSDRFVVAEWMLHHSLSTFVRNERKSSLPAYRTTFPTGYDPVSGAPLSLLSSLSLSFTCSRSSRKRNDHSYHFSRRRRDAVHAHPGSVLRQ
jgi:hypothetical protein